MQNIVQQQDSLQTLSDEQLQTQLQNPDGAMPSYLVLTEMQRRKNMRDAYEGERAQFQANQPTVAGQMGGAPAAPAAPPVAPAGGGGLAALRPGFQEGGLVNTTNYGDTYRRFLNEMGDRESGYGDMRERLAAMEAASDARLEDAGWMALIQAGLATAASGSSDIGQALGQGALYGMEHYKDANEAAREEALDRLGVESDIIRGEEARDIADIEAAQRAAQSEVAALQSDRDYGLAREQFGLSEDIFDFNVEDSDRQFGLAMDELQMTEDERKRAQERFDREFNLATDEFGLRKEEAERRAAQDAIANSLADRRVTVEEALANKPPATAQAWDHFLNMSPDAQEKILKLQGTSGSTTDAKTLAEATRLWSSARKAVDKELAEDPIYLQLQAEGYDDPVKAREAENMRFERYRERFQDDAPFHAHLVDTFGRATAQTAANSQADRGLNIVGTAATPPPGAEVISLDGSEAPAGAAELTEGPGTAVALTEAAPPSIGTPAERTEPPEWFSSPLGDTLADYIRGLDIAEEPEGGWMGEPLYRPGLRGLQNMLGE